jgi:excisionase family DNA binding protein
VWKLVDEGAIKVRRVGRAVRINRATLDAYMHGVGPDDSGDNG